MFVWMIRTYRDALEFLARATDYERMQAPPSRPRRWNLVRMRRLMEALGHPERAVRAIHIAGTKGKGTVAYLLDSILRESGSRVGLYTSPHLFDLRERIRVNGRPLSRPVFASRMREMEPHLVRIRPTFFETMTALALLAFRDVDWAVLEVGLGGRFDATNVVRPEVSVITRIGLEHTDVLGADVEAIAFEKAGIIKPGVPVVTGERYGPAAEVIRRRARALGAPLEVLEGGPQEIARGVAALLRVLRDAVERGIARARIPARRQQAGSGPRWIFDVAHTPESVAWFVADVLALPARRRWLLFGASADKQIEAMLRILAPAFDGIVVVEARHPRAAAAGAVARVARAAGAQRIFVAGGCEAGVKWIREHARRDDVAGTTGSFYVASEVIIAWRRGRTSARFRTP
jgi:dihydrofolate synthase/folylpolyglutamate synthase